MRTQVCTALYNLLVAEAADGVQVDRSWPADMSHRHIWLGPPSGEITYPAMAAGQWIRDDQFRIPVAAAVTAKGLSAEAAGEAVEALLYTIERAVFDGQSTIEEQVIDGTVLEVTISDVEGPTVEPDGDGEGYLAFVLVGVDVHGRRTLTL